MSASSRSSGVGVDADVLRLFVGLADAEQRTAAAHEFARKFGGTDLMVFLHDPEIGLALPAPGFPQTLPGGRDWQRFVQDCLSTGAHTAQVLWHGSVAVAAGVGESGSVLVVIGDAPRVTDLHGVRGVLPLLGATLGRERDARHAEAQARIAREANAQANRLTMALDLAHRELQTALLQAKQGRDAAATAEAKLREIFARAPAIIATLRGPNHVFESANLLCRQLIGQSDILGKSAVEVMPEMAEQGFIELLDRVYRTGEAFVANEMPVRFDRRGDGTLDEVFLNFVYQPLFDAHGSVSGILGHAVDITDQVRARSLVEQQAAALEELQAETEAINEELQQANEELAARTHEAEAARADAEEANQAKAAFLGTMSHELRTPLNAVIGYSDLLQAEITGPLTAGQRTQLGRISMAAQHLLQIIDEILTFSRIEAGRESVHLETADVAQLVRDSAALVEPLVAAKNLVFSYHAPDPLPVITDPRKVRQMILNLLSNAVKFTEEGEVRLEGLREGKEIIIRVRDTGIGIPLEQQDRIFEPFSQVEHTPSRRKDGTGLGLTVTAQLARLLDGEISFESTPGKGSTFTIRLPARATRKSGSQHQPPE